MYFYKLSDLHTVGKSLLFGLEIKKPHGSPRHTSPNETDVASSFSLFRSEKVHKVPIS